MLDPHAVVRLLRSDLPISIYPFATKEGPFAYGPHNCFWLLNDLRFIEAMQPQLRAYPAFAFSESNRMDFLRAMEEDPPPALLTAISKRTHNVWETCVWMEITGRHLVPRADGQFRILPAGEVKPGDTALPNELRPVRRRSATMGNSPGSRPTVRRTSGCTTAATPGGTKKRYAKRCRRFMSLCGHKG